MSEGLCTCGKPGEWMSDPYVAEIYGETVFGFWCLACHEERWYET